MKVYNTSNEKIEDTQNHHNPMHENGGVDEIDLTGLSGAPADVVAKALFDAHTILMAISDDTPVKLDVAASRIVGRASTGNIVALDKAGVLGIINVADGADVTGSNAPQAHKDSHDPDGSDPLDAATPSALLEVQAAGEGSASTWARSDHAHAIVHDITDNSLVTVDGTSNAPADNDYAKFTASGLEGRDKTEMLGDLNVADGADVTGSNAPQNHASLHTDGTDDIQESSTAQKGICQLDDTPVNGETNEPITSNWAFDHAALANAHGAVSAATASKIVVRDASARAKFAAPGASGDALIKGTRMTLAEMPALTASGDLITRGLAGAIQTLPVGNDGDVLTADSAVTKGIKWAAAATKEFWSPIAGGANMSYDSAWPSCKLGLLNEAGMMSFYIPHDFTGLTEAVVLILSKVTQASANLDISSEYGADGEDYNANTEADAATTYNITNLKLHEIDVSGILTGVAVNDYVAVKLRLGDANHDVSVLGIRIKYS